MAPLALPSFADGQYLSARQIEELDNACAELHGRAMSISIPILIQDDTDTAASSPSPTLVYDGYVIHYHASALAATEYLYYDVLVSGSGSVQCLIYYKNMATALVTLGPSGSRQRGIVSLVNKPTAPTHPDDGELVTVRIYAKRDGSNACTVQVFALEERIYPAHYTGLDSVTALTDGEAAAVAADLQEVSDNLGELDAIACETVPGFRCVRFDHSAGAPAPAAMAWRFPTNYANNLHYRIGYVKDVSDAGAISVVITVTAGGQTKSETLTYSGAWRGDDEPEIVEGQIDLSSLTSREMQQYLRIDVEMSYSGATGTGGAIIYYLGEGIGTAAAGGDYTDFGDAVHGAYVEGDETGAQLRTLYDNCKALAGDDGTGYGTDGVDIAGGFPAGYAEVVYRAPAIQNGIRHGAIPAGRIHIVSKCQRIQLRRSRDYLYYRGTHVEMAWTGVDGKEKTKGLADYDDDNPYGVQDLGELKDLPYGRWYEVRASVTQKGGAYGEWEGRLDFAVERFF